MMFLPLFPSASRVRTTINYGSHQVISRNRPSPPRHHGFGGLPAGGGAAAGFAPAGGGGFVPAGGGASVPAGGGAASAGRVGGVPLGGVPLEGVPIGSNPIHNCLYAAEVQRQARDAARRQQEQGNPRMEN